MVILQEYVGDPTIKDHLVNNGFFGEDDIGNTIHKILLLLKKLSDANLFHGRLTVNNIHLSNLSEVTLTDYGILNALIPS